MFLGDEQKGRKNVEKQDRTKESLVLLGGKGYNGKAYGKTSAYLCSAILKKIHCTRTNQERRK